MPGQRGKIRIEEGGDSGGRGVGRRSVFFPKWPLGYPGRMDVPACFVSLSLDVLLLGLTHRSLAHNGIIIVNVGTIIDIHLYIATYWEIFGVSEVALFAIAASAFHPETPTLKRDFSMLQSSVSTAASCRATLQYYTSL